MDKYSSISYAISASGDRPIMCDIETISWVLTVLFIGIVFLVGSFERRITANIDRLHKIATREINHDN